MVTYARWIQLHFDGGFDETKEVASAAWTISAATHRLQSGDPNWIVVAEWGAKLSVYIELVAVVEGVRAVLRLVSVGMVSFGNDNRILEMHTR